MKITHILKLNKKKIIILAVILLVAILGFNFFTRPKNQTLQFASVTKQDIKSTVSSSGTLTGRSVANLKFKSGGKLAYINVKAGDWVKKYQTIAGLDTQDLAIALQQAQNTLRDKQAIVDKVLDDVKDHSKDETFSQRQTRTTAEVARDNAYDSVKAAERAFQDAVIVSPIDGVVTQAMMTPGQTISGSDLVAQVVDMSAIYFDTDVDETDISKIGVGTPAEVTLDAYPGEVFKGLVDQILPQIKTTSSGATVVTVRIILDNPEIVFVNSLSGESAIIYQSSLDTLTLPQEAIRDDETVFVQTDQGLKPQKVEVGIKSDTDAEIKNGLNENDKILLNPPSEGARIQNRNPLQRIIFRVFGGPRGVR